MQTTARRPTTARQAAYQREIREAVALGVRLKDVATVVAAFRGEHPDIDEFRTALQQYVPAVAIFAAEESRAA